MTKLLPLLSFLALLALSVLAPLSAEDIVQTINSNTDLTDSNTSWVTALALLLLGPVLSLTAALIAIITIWFFMRGNKGAALYGLGMFIFLAFILSLANLFVRQGFHGAPLLDVQAPIFGLDRDEFAAFSFFAGSVLGYFEIGALIATRVMTSVVFMTFFACAFVLGGMVLAYRTAMTQDQGIGGIVRYLIVAILIVGTCVFPIVQFNLTGPAAEDASGEVSSRSVLNLHSARDGVHAMWGFGATLDDAGDPVPPADVPVSRVPLFAAFIMAASNGIAEELALAFYGQANIENRLEDANANKNMETALRYASIPVKGAERAAYFGSYCNSALTAMRQATPTDRRGGTDKEVTEGNYRLGNLQSWVDSTINRWEGTGNLQGNGFYRNPLSPAALDLYYYVDASAWIRRARKSDTNAMKAHIRNYVKRAKSSAAAVGTDHSPFQPEPHQWRYQSNYAVGGQPFLNDKLSYTSATITTAPGNRGNARIEVGYAGAIDEPDIMANDALSTPFKDPSLPGLWDTAKYLDRDAYAMVRHACFQPGVSTREVSLDDDGYRLILKGWNETSDANVRGFGYPSLYFMLDGDSGNMTSNRGVFGTFSKITVPPPVVDGIIQSNPVTKTNDDDTQVQLGDKVRIWVPPSTADSVRSVAIPGLHHQTRPLGEGSGNQTFFLHDLSLVATGSITMGYSAVNCRDAASSGPSHPLFWGCFNRIIGNAGTEELGTIRHSRRTARRNPITGELISMYRRVNGGNIAGSSQDGPLFQPSAVGKVYNDMARLTQWSQSFQPLTQEDMDRLDFYDPSIPSARLDAINNAFGEGLVVGTDASNTTIQSGTFYDDHPSAAVMFHIFGDISMNNGASLTSFYGRDNRILGPIGLLPDTVSWNDDSNQHTLFSGGNSRYAGARLFAWTMSSTPKSMELIQTVADRFPTKSEANNHVNPLEESESKGFWWLVEFFTGSIDHIYGFFASVVLVVFQLLIGLFVIVAKAVFAHALGAVLMVLLALFFLVPIFGVYPGQWGILLSWARTVLWVCMWPAFFVVGHVISGQAMVNPLTFPTYGDIIQSVVLEIIGLSFMISAPATAALVLTATSNGFSQIASMSYGSFMKAVGGAVAIAGLATGLGLVGAKVIGKGGLALAGKAAGSGNSVVSTAGKGVVAAANKASAIAEANKGKIGAVKGAAHAVATTSKQGLSSIASVDSTGMASSGIGFGQSTHQVGRRGAGQAVEYGSRMVAGTQLDRAKSDNAEANEARMSSAARWMNRAENAAQNAGTTQDFVASSTSMRALQSESAARAAMAQAQQVVNSQQGDGASMPAYQSALQHAETAMAHAKQMPEGHDRTMAMASAATLKAQAAVALNRASGGNRDDLQHAALNEANAANSMAYQSAMTRGDSLAAGHIMTNAGNLAASGNNSEAALASFSQADAIFARGGDKDFSHRMYNAGVAHSAGVGAQHLENAITHAKGNPLLARDLAIGQIMAKHNDLPDLNNLGLGSDKIAGLIESGNVDAAALYPAIQEALPGYAQMGLGARIDPRAGNTEVGMTGKNTGKST